MLFWLTALKKSALFIQISYLQYSLGIHKCRRYWFVSAWKYKSIYLEIIVAIFIFMTAKMFLVFSGRNQTRSRDETSLSFFSSSETREPSGWRPDERSESAVYRRSPEFQIQTQRNARLFQVQSCRQKGQERKVIILEIIFNWIFHQKSPREKDHRSDEI
jgi:hypothetical protein